MRFVMRVFIESCLNFLKPSLVLTQIRKKLLRGGMNFEVEENLNIKGFIMGGLAPFKLLMECPSIIIDF